jgi:Mn2+/Fe2+ NRAMP family transporter
MSESLGRNGWQRAWKQLKDHPVSEFSPGLITGVADDDPSGVVTYSQAGAEFGLNMLWTMPLAFPLMATIQFICGLIGRVTGRGLAANIKDAFPPFILKGVVILLLVANTLNIAADLAAMGEVGELVTGMNRNHSNGPLLIDPSSAASELRRIRWDTWSGMFYSNRTAYFIILATAVTLHVPASPTSRPPLRRPPPFALLLEIRLSFSLRSASSVWA